MKGREDRENEDEDGEGKRDGREHCIKWESRSRRDREEKNTTQEAKYQGRNVVSLSIFPPSSLSLSSPLDIPPFSFPFSVFSLAL